jgi:phage terminase large subunit-like protein
VSTAWPRIVAKCRELGVEFDEWQHGIGQIALGKREDGKYAATVGGVVLSIPRQVGKTFLVGMIVIALCLLHPGLTVLWTAHRTRTATKTFHTLKGMTERAKVKPHMLEPRLSNGEQEIRFRNGSVIMFGAREQGFGRGFDEVDVEVFDEAQILSERALEDMVPATNQSRHPAGALLFFMGTPPRPGDPGEEFTNRRDAALAGQTEDTVYVEFSADDDADLDDRAQWRKANPSFPRRTPVEAMKRMRANLTDDDSYRREALGIWQSLSSEAIPRAAWAACADVESKAADPVVFGFDVSPDRSRSSISVVGKRDDGKLHVAVVDSRAGVDWLVARCVDLQRHEPLCFAVDPAGPAGALIQPMREAGLDVVEVPTRPLTQACGLFFDLVVAGDLAHRDEGVLNAAVAGAAWRPVGDARAWARKTSSSDITPLYAATVALHAFGERDKPADPGVWFI